ncbi:uncharacterized protein N7483_004561 [Penicillium malachiteum]|uniref:uncharacterized protein n=1 Tax=Penicillium malachiteum TaxID=1324776 RepID=UPI002547E01F|nr:uncharacterized protein N7483_004561 [Penicillium malachiteum]KAJ5730053.1 hypothetical protein N7483_004561 [Penicillium malachiteum]
MNSWRSSSHTGDEQHYTGWSSNTSTSNQPSPNFREHALQPPLLTTALSGIHFQSGTTPLSSTSLSSPFIHGQSPAVASPAIGRSPPSSRQPSNYNVPYNPQDWGPLGGAPAQAQYAHAGNQQRVVSQNRGQSDEPLSPPPPPYSPPSNPNQVSQGTFGSPNPNVSVTPNIPPQNPSRDGNFNISPEYPRRSGLRPRPLSVAYTSENQPQQSLPPPPPPQGYPGSRSISHSRLDGNQNTPYHSTASHSRTRASISSSYEQNQPQQNIRGPPPGHSPELQISSRPPASRRAASAGAIVHSAGSSRAQSQTRNQSPPNSGWAPGMPLPPPPPGPPPGPPPAARSVSLSDSSESSSARTSLGPPRARARPPPVMGTSLGSIPPTPANWVDEEYLNSRPAEQNQPLQIDTSIAMPGADITEHLDSRGNVRESQRTPGSGGLFRSPAVRDPSAKGIRERRIERRNRQSQTFDDLSAISSSGNPWAEALDQIKPTNLILPEARNSPDPTRPPSSSRFTPKSARSLPSSGKYPPSRSRASSGGLFSDDSSPYPTPKAEPSPGVGPSNPPAPATLAHTPPFSPKGESASSYAREIIQPTPPKALPTPPLGSGKEFQAQPRPRALSRGADSRPISHILHMPNDAIASMKPLSPRRIPSREAMKQNSLEAVMKQDTEFMQDAILRHQKFIEAEAAAPNETEALKAFTQFIIAESAIRRDRYATVWDSGSFDSAELHKKLFKVRPAQTEIEPANKPPRPAPKLDIPQNRLNRPESAWWNNYQPCLSPIASINMSNDEMSSRGRAPSRWWESQSSSDGNGRRVQRSKRESKYMGLVPDAVQWDQQQRTPMKLDDDAANYTDENAAYGPDEYPPEKVGWHEEENEYPSSASKPRYERPVAIPQMDISRLITLPPPYPRHHPAVNNSHPELVSYRTTVRSITDLSEIKSTRQRYANDVDSLIQEHQTLLKESRLHFRANIQSQIQEGSLTFGEAAEAETAMIVEENRGERDLAKRQLDLYQEMVLKPMHNIVKDRLERATSCIDELSSKLFDDAQHETPDQTQEEGDEQPELLEKLTQLKWLFEAREQLHREAFDLISGRDEKYKSVALLPYQQSKNEDKLRETQAFFTKDSLDRRVQYEMEALSRLESFLDIIEQNVVRGVEKQLSAFWDIAPSLLALVQQVPDRLRGFKVQIPAKEYEENPSYHAHPLQYLHSLLSHAEKSSYQYIESQTNLLCLLHEVRSALMRANSNLTEAERIQQGEPEEIVRQIMDMTRADEEASLTLDLKDKVATVESQWTEALGSQIEELRGRVKEQLVNEDAWDDLEQLEQE